MALDEALSGSLIERLSARFGAAFEALGGEPALGGVVVSQRPELGQFQCNGSMAAAKTLRRKPREIAEEILEKVRDPEVFEELSIAGPGFINIRLTDACLGQFTQMLATDERLGVAPEAPARRIVVDYGGPNVAKPMHVGHLRSTIIGNSLVRLMRFLGHEVQGDIHLGDWGTQMGMLIVELQERQPDLPYFDPEFTGPYPEESPVTLADLQEMYPAISSKCQQDEALRNRAQTATVELQKGRPGYRALWQHFRDISVEELKEDFHRLGVDFELWYGESDYQNRIPSMVESMKEDGVAVEDEGALVIHVAEESDNKPVPPVLLLKRDGGTNYHTTDLATIRQRVGDLGADTIFYVVDKRQSLHFEQLFRAARKSGLASETLMEHLPFGTMNGKDGRPFKTRAGGVMRLKDLIEMMRAEAHQRMLEANVAQDYGEEERERIAQTVGLGALKYADLMNVRTADYVFDIERFTKFEGRTGSYLLYAAVRIKSILRKAAERGLQPGEVIAPTAGAERDLMLQLAQLPEAIRVAAGQRMPHHLCAFAFDLGQALSRFYSQCHILDESEPARQASWLALITIVLRELELLLDLLGIEIPERM